MGIKALCKAWRCPEFFRHCLPSAVRNDTGTKQHLVLLTHPLHSSPEHDKELLLPDLCLDTIGFLSLVVVRSDPF